MSMSGLGDLSPYDSWKLSYPEYYDDDDDTEEEGDDWDEDEGDDPGNEEDDDDQNLVVDTHYTCNGAPHCEGDRFGGCAYCDSRARTAREAKP